MTSTQYLLGWLVYLAGATGCLFSLWLITRQLPVRIQRVLCLGATALLYTPWWTKANTSYLAPAFLTAIFDGLGQGPEAMERAGLVAVAALAASTLIALLLPIRQSDNDAGKEKKARHSHTKRKEPTYGE
ncbi:hypothetical protein [Candidatus Sororendozoicomonas aggregata]|uniref:hypothetical protein n=1 Tax=Candidatus Sororendozoicomonas aggregata TaxID=3073239 RepID=UPI002ED016B0